MTAPIFGFAEEYRKKKPVRLHMPGHKGKTFLGPEASDLTEIPGADVLYHADGIILRSEDQASGIFGTGRTLYSTEGSSLCIRAMLYLARLYAETEGRSPTILAGRNAHSVFLTGAALLDVNVDWIFPEEGDGLLRCTIDPDKLERMLEKKAYAAVYITSPDYLGHIADIAACAEACHRHGALLLVDNAHGAYLKFLPESLHPMDLGADLCCDSAHKTLPVLTGGAYLHFSERCPADLQHSGEAAMRLFASTSPSYLILQSMDQVNGILAAEFPSELVKAADMLDSLKSRLNEDGWQTVGDERLKLTLAPKERGLTGTETARILEEQHIFCEFADPDYIVFMVSPSNEPEELEALYDALRAIPQMPAIEEKPPEIRTHIQHLPLRKALLSPFETLPVHCCQGRTLAAPTVSCPPAVPILVCGEMITEEAISLFNYYGIQECDVVL